MRGIYNLIIMSLMVYLCRAGDYDSVFDAIALLIQILVVLVLLLCFCCVYVCIKKHRQNAELKRLFDEQRRKNRGLQLEGSGHGGGFQMD